MSESLLYYLIPVTFFGSIYFILIAGYTYGWFTLRTFYPGNHQSLGTLVSIIVPARNEEQNITNLLEDFAIQDYPAGLFEIIIIDDHSTDQTASLVKQFIARNREIKIRLLSMKDHKGGLPYKKKAIAYAISRSAGDLIVTTDADCRMKPGWLRSLVLYYQEYKPKMIVGPVSFHNEKNFFQRIQTPEFLSLIAITAGSVNIGRPVMCNGANLAYEKDAFNGVGGFGQQDNMPSGDDVFLLLKIRKKFGGSSVKFIRNLEAVVFTEARRTPADFFQQRIRWASKNKVYDIKILLVSSSVYFMNLLLVAGLVHLIMNPEYARYVILIFLVKLLIDLPLLTGVVFFIRRYRLLLYAIPLILVYPFYIVITGALGILGGYTWKGRSHNNIVKNAK